MNAKEKLKKLVEEGTLTPEDLSELGLELEPEVETPTEEPTGEPKIEEPEKIEEASTHTEPTEEKVQETPPVDNNGNEVTDGNDKEENPEEIPEENPEVKKQEPSEIELIIQEFKDALNGVVARVSSIEEALQKVTVTVPDKESNSDFGTQSTAPMTDEGQNNDFMEDIIKKMGGFSR